MNNRVTEAQILETDWQLPEGGVGAGMKDGEGIYQRTFMCNPWTGTKIWELARGGKRVGLGGSEGRGEKWEQL